MRQRGVLSGVEVLAVEDDLTPEPTHGVDLDRVKPRRLGARDAAQDAWLVETGSAQLTADEASQARAAATELAAERHGAVQR